MIINILLILSIFTFFLLNDSLYSEQINPTKQEMWDEMSNEVSHWVDELGYPIDTEIKDTVVALNLLGIETTASCEGHLDHGFAFPSVKYGICQKQKI